MKLQTNEEWAEWGRRDPLFGVANWVNKNVEGSAPWTDAEFYELGKSDWEDFEPHWKRYGYSPETFVEIGCGAGRITRQLALGFESGHALDVSKDMIEYAKARVPAQNVQWHVTQGTDIPLEDNSVAAAFSCYVLQHLPKVEFGHLYFKEMFRTLKPGGTLMIHLPMHLYPIGVSRKFASLCDFMFRRLLVPAKALRARIGRLGMKWGRGPTMHGLSYDQMVLLAKLTSFGFERIEFNYFTVRSNGVLHPFVFAAKPLGK